VRMHLDLIGPEVEHHGTDFAAEGGADRHGRRGLGHRPKARRWCSGKGREAAWPVPCRCSGAGHRGEAGDGLLGRDSAM
jgi:hypothetical protein